MTDRDQSRISVLQNDRVVPLIPSARPPSAPRSIDRIQPWGGILLERHRVSAIEIPEHEHREFCLHLQTSGHTDMEWWSDGRHALEKTAPGSMILLPPGTRDRLRWQESSERLILSVEPDLLLRAAEATSSHPVDFASQWSLTDSSLQHLMLEMGREASLGWPLGGLYADLLAASLTHSLLRRHAIRPVAFPDHDATLPMPRLRHAMEYMTTNLHLDLRLEEIARELGLSPFHFAREFRNSTGQSPYQYLLDQRITHAKLLLKGHSWSVQEIALMTGFGSPVNFVRAFRQRVGQTPGAWRTSA